MATEKQVEANRKNAKRSTGPKTPEGKEAVRFNALKHGMRADSFAVIRGENPAEFAERLSGWNISYDPTGPVEANLVRRAVVLSWRIDRATRFENAVLNRRVRDAVMACDCDDNDVEALTEAAGLAFFDASPEGEKIPALSVRAQSRHASDHGRFVEAATTPAEAADKQYDDCERVHL